MGSEGMLSDATKRVDETKLKEFMGRVVNDLGATWSTVLVIIGNKLGLYKAMADSRPVSAEELANELEFSESCMRVRGENVRKELILLHSSYPSNPRPNKNTRKNKTRKSAKPTPVQRRNLFRVEKEGRESFEDVIVSDEIIKVVLQLFINNKRENIQVIAYSDNSITISYRSSEGKQSSRTSALPYGIDIETARSTYRNGILEITFDRK
jgi:HSP20 family molecular chaperone IbpA